MFFYLIKRWAVNGGRWASSVEHRKLRNILYLFFRFSSYGYTYSRFIRIPMLVAGHEHDREQTWSKCVVTTSIELNGIYMNNLLTINNSNISQANNKPWLFLSLFRFSLSVFISIIITYYFLFVDPWVLILLSVISHRLSAIFFFFYCSLFRLSILIFDFWLCHFQCHTSIKSIKLFSSRRNSIAIIIIILRV